MANQTRIYFIGSASQGAIYVDVDGDVASVADKFKDGVTAPVELATKGGAMTLFANWANVAYLQDSAAPVAFKIY
jgi:hypothetical protein